MSNDVLKVGTLLWVEELPTMAIKAARILCLA